LITAETKVEIHSKLVKSASWYFIWGYLACVICQLAGYYLPAAGWWKIKLSAGR
jgi:hypothetical protein